MEDSLNTDINFLPVNTPDVGLKTSIHKSRVDFVALSDGYGLDDVRNLINKKSLGAFSLHEILYNLVNESEGEPYKTIKKWAEKGKHPVFLGIDAPGDDHEAGSRLAGSHPWLESYKELKIDINDPDRTNKFMSKITRKRSEHRPIVFVIPNNFQKYYEGKETETYKEFKWLLDNPDKAESVMFVFENDLINDEHSSIKGRPESERYQIIARSLSRMYDYMEGVDQKAA